ncbi:hypothetical protein BsIDN1_45920 [Bacillus safensis]|uniref:Uncharacterized protein n=1 Tax=Bacillus safensis TaxID=561879 RepID=A0A5S9MFQ6_BACIA|nr:hypothetical protein BsIDN1_45920 [Bacillus safensis]
MLDAKALTSAMDTRAKHYQELREQMVDLKRHYKAWQISVTISLGKVRITLKVSTKSSPEM